MSSLSSDFSGVEECPLISVVMPAFNAERTIVCAIQSVLLQSYKNLELIVCDDASSDGTLELLRSIDDCRLIVVRNGVNMGPGLSRDIAIDHARGKWIAFVDSDDWWVPGRLHRLLASAEDGVAEVVFDNTLMCHDADDRLVPWRSVHGYSAFGTCGEMDRDIRVAEYIRADRLLMHPMIRTDFIRNHGVRHSARRFAEDAEFYLKLAHAGAKLRYVPESMYYYRISPGSLTELAGNPSLMRRCLEECSQWEGWREDEKKAFSEKIRALRINEELFAFVQQIRSFSFIGALSVVFRHPRLIVAIPKKTVRQVAYHFSRIINNGRRRALIK